MMRFSPYCLASTPAGMLTTSATRPYTPVKVPICEKLIANSFWIDGSSGEKPRLDICIDIIAATTAR